MTSQRINLDQPRWDQETYAGRAKHFFTITNPLNILKSDKELSDAKLLIDQYRNGMTSPELSADDIWRAKQLVDSAYHPDTGEKNFVLGRMSFQVPGNMIITGCMMTFYKSTPAVIFWQFMNQTFNSIVNYTNRNASTGVSTEQLAQAYVAATGASVISAVGLNKLVARSPRLRSGIIGRFVPFVAVAAANCVNIPLMRQRELVEGIDIELPDGTVAGKSKVAAKQALAQVIPSRILMAVPGMLIPPIMMSRLERNQLLRRKPWLNAPMTVALTGVCLCFSTPLCCALFPQRSSLNLDAIEPTLQEHIRHRFAPEQTHLHPSSIKLFYNKGL